MGEEVEMEETGGDPVPRAIQEAFERLAGYLRAELVPLSGEVRGAMALGAEGEEEVGASVEIPGAPHLSVCAEHVALAGAVLSGFAVRDLVVLSGRPASEALPCGVCRQVLRELAPDARVWIRSVEGTVRRLEAAALLPRPFEASHLPGGEDEG
jgi:cytidine deaminase